MGWWGGIPIWINMITSIIAISQIYIFQHMYEWIYKLYGFFISEFLCVKPVNFNEIFRLRYQLGVLLRYEYAFTAEVLQAVNNLAHIFCTDNWCLRKAQNLKIYLKICHLRNLSHWSRITVCTWKSFKGPIYESC